MRDIDREAEALLYWRTVSSARQIRRDDPKADLTVQQDDLDLIAFHTAWDRMKDFAAAAAAQLAPALDIDLTVFDATPPEFGAGAA